MKLALHLTVCVFTTVYAVPDQTWNAKMEDRVDKLEKNNNYKDVEDRVQGMQRYHDKMEKRFNEIVSAMATRMLDLTNRVQTMEQNNEQLLSENSQLRNTIQELGAEASSSALISFTAKMTSGYFVPDGEDIVPFDFVITNPGGHFDETTYKFTCPLEGLYFFMFSLYSGDLQAGTDYEVCGGILVMDGTRIVEAYGRHYDTDLYDQKQVSNSAVVLCAEGAEVYVTAPWNNTGIWGNIGQTTFAGFIL